jgi:hypothetical protein
VSPNFRNPMKSTLRLVAAALSALVASAQLAFGALIDSPVPTNAYITKDGFDWAWAYPLSADAAGASFDLSYQGQFGWRIPTADELLFAPYATDFLVSWGNVPFDNIYNIHDPLLGFTSGVDPVSGAFFRVLGDDYINAGSAGAVAVPYFSIDAPWADWSNGLGQYGCVWAGMEGSQFFSDQLVVRGVPETTSTLGLLGLVIGAVAMLRRRFGR